MSFRFLGTGSCVPERVVTNEELSRFVDTSDEWITQRVGVKTRHVCTEETAADLAAEAARRALENAAVESGELDLILCATVSGEDVCPSVGCMVQQAIGASCPAFDLNAACPAFLYLLETAAGFFARGYGKILVVGAERMSRIVDWTDRATCVIFGDGAGAAVLGRGDGYLSSKLATFGGDKVIKIPQHKGNSPFWQGGEEAHPYIHMNGQETYKFAVRALRRDLMDVIERAGLQQQDVDHVIPHQANYRIIHDARKRLEIPPDRFRMNIDRVGNTSAASIPLLLDELNRGGMLQRGQILAMCAFGGGLSSAACIVRW